METDKPTGSRWLDVVLAAVVVAMALKMAWRIDTVRDLRLADEAHYLAAGCFLPEQGLPAAAYAPLYAVWYYLLSCVQPDPVQLYYLNWTVLSCLLPAGVYVLIRTLGGPRGVGLLAAFVVVNSNLIDIWPYPAHLATVLLLFGVSLALRAPTAPWRLALIALAMLVTTWIRPEWLVGAVVCGVGLCAMVLRRTLWSDGRDLCPPLPCTRGRGVEGEGGGVDGGELVCTGDADPLTPTPLPRVQRRGETACRTSLQVSRSAAWAVTVVGVIAVMLLSVLGNPTSGGRSWIAFGQHYAANVALAEGSTRSPATQWRSFTAADFGTATSFTAAARANPEAVAWHVTTNLSRLPGAVMKVLGASYELPRPWRRVAGVGTMLFLAGGMAAFVWRWRSEGADEPASVQRRWALAALGVISVPALTAALLIQPREHYLMAPVLFATALAASGWRFPNAWGTFPNVPVAQENGQVGKPGPRLGARVALAILALGLLIAVPNRAYRWDVVAPETDSPRGATHAVVAALQEVAASVAPEKLCILEDGYSHALYAGVAFKSVDWRQHRLRHGFTSLLARKNINVVALTPLLRKEERFRDDPEFQAFCRGESPVDFELLPVPGADTVLAVRRSASARPLE